MKFFVGIVVLVFHFASAQLAADRTRIVFDHEAQASQSLTIKNNSNHKPYLIQVWIEDHKGDKILKPLVAVPILQRVEPGASKQVKVELPTIYEGKALPQDRESLFYFNFLGLPAKEDEDGNDVNIIIVNKLKLFYRPKGLVRENNYGWLNKVEVYKTGKGLKLKNTTPYHIVIFEFDSGDSNSSIEKDIVISPFETVDIDFSLRGNNPGIHYISDTGGEIFYKYSCHNEEKCEIQKVFIETDSGLQEM